MTKRAKAEIETELRGLRVRHGTMQARLNALMRHGTSTSPEEREAAHELSTQLPILRAAMLALEQELWKR
jgi:hypothetical protein